MLKRLTYFLLCLVLCATGLGYWSFSKLTTWPLAVTEASTLELKPGDTALGLFQRAKERHWLPASSQNYLLRLFLSQRPDWAQIKAGHYGIYPGDSLLSVARRLRAGDVLMLRFTVVEGQRFNQLRRQLESLPNLSNDIEGLSDAELMRRLGRENIAPEGRFLPDSYQFEHGTGMLSVLRHMADHLDRELNAAWNARQAGSILKTPAELLTLASIIEKETGVDAERAEISGVFHRRLRKGMRLQTDPTVIYGLGDAFDGNLTRKHLRTDTPWNTYTRQGLPPTPIALVGTQSLRAAGQPAEGETLYFVANGQGGHVFSRTLEQHQAAVRRYQLGGR